MKRFFTENKIFLFLGIFFYLLAWTSSVTLDGITILDCESSCGTDTPTDEIFSTGGTCEFREDELQRVFTAMDFSSQILRLPMDSVKFTSMKSKNPYGSRRFSSKVLPCEAFLDALEMQLESVTRKTMVLKVQGLNSSDAFDYHKNVLVDFPKLVNAMRKVAENLTSFPERVYRETLTIIDVSVNEILFQARRNMDAEMILLKLKFGEISEAIRRMSVFHQEFPFLATDVINRSVRELWTWSDGNLNETLKQTWILQFLEKLPEKLRLLGFYELIKVMGDESDPGDLLRVAYVVRKEEIQSKEESWTRVKHQFPSFIQQLVWNHFCYITNRATGHHLSVAGGPLDETVFMVPEKRHLWAYTNSTQWKLEPFQENLESPVRYKLTNFNFHQISWEDTKIKLQNSKSESVSHYPWEILFPREHYSVYVNRTRKGQIAYQVIELRIPGKGYLFDRTESHKDQWWFYQCGVTLPNCMDFSKHEISEDKRMTENLMVFDDSRKWSISCS